MNYISEVNLPTNGYRDMVTGTVYQYANGDAKGREAAHRAAVEAQNALRVSLGLPAGVDLASFKEAHAASQE